MPGKPLTAPCPQPSPGLSPLPAPLVSSLTPWTHRPEVLPQWPCGGRSSHGSHFRCGTEPLETHRGSPCRQHHGQSPRAPGSPRRPEGTSEGGRCRDCRENGRPLAPAPGASLPRVSSSCPAGSQTDSAATGCNRGAVTTERTSATGPGSQLPRPSEPSCLPFLAKHVTVLWATGKQTVTGSSPTRAGSSPTDASVSDHGTRCWLGCRHPSPLPADEPATGLVTLENAKAPGLGGGAHRWAMETAFRSCPS